MRNLQTTTPDGDAYDVAVDWMPRWRMQSRRFLAYRRRRKGLRLDLDLLDVPDVDGPAGLVIAIGVVVGLVVAAVLFWWVLLPVLLVVLDAAAIALLLAAGIATRVLLRRPWTVSVRVRGVEDGAPVASVEVVGWRRALRTRDALAAAVAQGTNPVTAALAAPPA